VNETGFLFRVGGNFYKTAMVIIGFLIAFYIVVDFRLWGMEWTEYFLRLGSLEEVIFVSLVVAGVGIVVLALLKWFLRLELR
jgi:hypothetical protein